MTASPIEGTAEADDAAAAEARGIVAMTATFSGAAGQVFFCDSMAGESVVL